MMLYCYAPFDIAALSLVFSSFNIEINTNKC